MEALFPLFISVIGTLFVVGFGFAMIRRASKKSDPIPQNLNNAHVSEESFQKYAKFYGEVYPHEEQFDVKLKKIYTLIKEQHMDDIKKIAELSFCTIPQCVIKIKYLENKRLIDNVYIDTANFKILPCTKEDEDLINLYKPYIYGTHVQIADFVGLIDNTGYLSTDEREKKILNDLLYLDKKGLLNGVKIDDVDGKIIYYALEKRKKSFDKETVHCPNCGALNDVELTGKTRCSYCESIVMGSKCND